MAQMKKPVGVSDAVIIGVGDDGAGGETGTQIAGDTESGMLLKLVAHLRMGFRDLGDVLAGTVIDEQDFAVGITQRHQRIQALAQRGGTIVSADHH